MSIIIHMKTNIKSCFDIKIKLTKTEFFIILSTLVIGFIFSFFPYNKYLINEDARQVVYWAYQIRDNGLFKNDLLTAYAKDYQPWGYYLLYSLIARLIDPMVGTKLLAIIIYSLSAVYIFKLLKYLTNYYGGLLFSTIYFTSYIPTAALPREFGYLFLIIFSFYLINKQYSKTALALIILALFYPMVCILCLVTFLLSFIRIKGLKFYFDKSIVKINFFIIAILGCALILGGKYLLSYNPNIGSTITRKQMLTEYSSYSDEGRFSVLPTPSITRELINYIYYSYLFSLDYDHLLPAPLKTISPKFVFFVILIFLFIAYKALLLPKEILALFFAGLLTYKIADIFIFKLFLPIRYLSNSIPLVCFLIFSILIFRLLNILKNIYIRKSIYLLLVFVLLIKFFYNFEVLKKTSFTDYSSQKEVFEYIHTLPKDVLIAGAPKDIINSVPTLSQRKAFLTYELSHAVYDNYWKTIKKRTLDFYNAYYSENPQDIYNFLQKYNIDYLIVNNIHFTKDYIMGRHYYIEPFNTYIKNLITRRQNFVLANIPDNNKLFIEDNIFVISKDSLSSQL